MLFLSYLVPPIGAKPLKELGSDLKGLLPKRVNHVCHPQALLGNWGNWGQATGVTGNWGNWGQVSTFYFVLSASLGSASVQKLLHPQNKLLCPKEEPWA